MASVMKWVRKSKERDRKFMGLQWCQFRNFSSWETACQLCCTRLHVHVYEGKDASWGHPELHASVRGGRQLATAGTGEEAKKLNLSSPGAAQPL